MLCGATVIVTLEIDESKSKRIDTCEYYSEDWRCATSSFQFR